MDTYKIEFVGMIAACLTTASFLPQVYKIWKAKSAKEVSLTMFLTMFLGVILWMTYGILIGSFSMVVANLITAFLAAIIIYYKIKYD